MWLNMILHNEIYHAFQGYLTVPAALSLCAFYVLVIILSTWLGLTPLSRETEAQKLRNMSMVAMFKVVEPEFDPW